MGFQPFTADIGRIREVLARATPEDPNVPPGAPSRYPRRKVELSLPMPSGGTFARFEVEEIAIMHPALAPRNIPRSKPTAAAAWMILAPRSRSMSRPPACTRKFAPRDGAIYIDPYYRDNDRVYASYYKADVLPQRAPEPLLLRNAGRSSACGIVNLRSRRRAPDRLPARSCAPIDSPAPRTAPSPTSPATPSLPASPPSSSS